MKADLSDSLVSRLFDLAIARMRENRVFPSPNSIGRGEYRCEFSDGVFFSSGLNSENVLIFLDTNGNSVDVFAVSPLILRRIREFLLYEGEYVVLHNSIMTPLTFRTWEHLLSMSYTMRQLNADSKWVFDMKEWVGNVKIALTSDWSSDAVSMVSRGKLDVNYCVQVLTYVFDVQVKPIRLYYSACYVKISRDGSTEMFGLLISPSRQDQEAYFDKFRSRYGRHYGTPEVLQEGVLTYDNVRDMYEALTPIVSRVHSVQEGQGLVDLGVCAGLRIFNPSYNRFLYRWEKF